MNGWVDELPENLLVNLCQLNNCLRGPLSNQLFPVFESLIIINYILHCFPLKKCVIPGVRIFPSRHTIQQFSSSMFYLIKRYKNLGRKILNFGIRTFHSISTSLNTYLFKAFSAFSKCYAIKFQSNLKYGV